MLFDLIDADRLQLEIFETAMTEPERIRAEKLMATIDMINKLQGRDAVRFGMTTDHAA
ncbi:hypothetical protein [Phytohalomonas tamaricis]|uniref:hypothetical protein n=1 Tax=Phytohalomonas tamaricis TaxID=2081032 RepID=UPI001319E681|nr:hypothetical protein [Phytohalomonas tamaricis]